MNVKARALEGQLIGRGGTAEVFAWDEGRVLKLFQSWYPSARAEIEFKITQILRSEGLPVPEAHQLVQIDDRTGIIFEQVHGISMLTMVERQPWKLFYAARLLADLHAEVHRLKAPGELPTQRDQIEAWLAAAEDFTEQERLAARESLGALPEGTTLCHGDFHPDNILFCDRGPVVIDWSGATRGHPYADVARTSVMFESAELPKESTVLVRILFRFARGVLHQTYLRRYLQLRGGTPEEIGKWRPAQRAAASAWRSGKAHW